MVLQTGEVIRVWDRQVRPPNYKRMICVVPEKQFFLRVNTRAIWEPCVPIAADGANFLDHDSYIELRELARPLAYELSRADHLGRITAEHAALLLPAVQIAITLSQEHKDLIIERLRPLVPSND